MTEQSEQSEQMKKPNLQDVHDHDHGAGRGGASGRSPSRSAAVFGMLVTFIGGYLLGSLTAGGPGESRAAVAKRREVPVSDSPVKGSDSPLVTIVEFADFQCPHCARSVPLYRRVLSEYGDQVRWVFKHLPLSFHPQAMTAAQASMAAHAQGQFWEYHDKLFKNQRQLSEKDLVARAGELGLDLERFRGDLTGKIHEKGVKEDMELAKKLKVQGTPNFFINGRHFMGAMRFSRMKKVIREEIIHAQKLMKGGVARKDLYQELTQPPPATPASAPAVKPDQSKETKVGSPASKADKS